MEADAAFGSMHTARPIPLTHTTSPLYPPHPHAQHTGWAFTDLKELKQPIQPGGLSPHT